MSLSRLWCAEGFMRQPTPIATLTVHSIWIKRKSEKSQTNRNEIFEWVATVVYGRLSLSRTASIVNCHCSFFGACNEISHQNHVGQNQPAKAFHMLGSQFCLWCTRLSWHCIRKQNPFCAFWSRHTIGHPSDWELRFNI